MAGKNEFEPVNVGTGDHTEDGVSLYRATGPDGKQHAALMPKALGKLGKEGILMASDIQHTVISIRKQQEELEELIEQARDLGMSWNSIGWCVGTTGDAARQRWGVMPSEPEAGR